MSEGVERDTRKAVFTNKDVAFAAGGLVIGAVILLIIIGGGMRGFTS